MVGLHETHITGSYIWVTSTTLDTALKDRLSDGTAVCEFRGEVYALFH